MPFGSWTEDDWRLRDRWAHVPGPYLTNDEAATPSDVLLQAKAEARRMRSTVSLSKASLAGKTTALSRGGPSLGSTHFSSRMHNSSTSIGELQDSVDTATLVSPFSSCDDDSELVLEHSEMILQNWKKEGRPKLWLADKILGSPRGDASILTFEDGVDHTLTSASMVLFKVQNDSYGVSPKEEEQKFTVTDAVQLIAGGTVIGAVAEDMLRKLKTTNGRQGLSRSYVETCERFGKLADKVKEVFEQMEEISKFEVEKANLRVKLRAGDVNAGAMAKALGREGDVDLIAKISAASEHDDDEDQIDGKEKLISDIEAMLTRNDLALLLKEVLATLDCFKWQDLATELRKWSFATDSSADVIRRVLDESVELQREAIGVLTLSKFLAEETLSSHTLLAAKNLADFHEAIDREMKVMLEKCGLDDSITLRMLTDAKSQMLVEGYSTQKSGLVVDEDPTASGRVSRNSLVPGFNPSELTEEQKTMVYERDTQRRNHKRIMSDLYALVQEHKRKVELSRSLHDHMMMTTMRNAAPKVPTRPPSQDGQSYLKSAMSKKDTAQLQEPPDIEDSASDRPPSADASQALAAAAAAAAPASAPAGPGSEALERRRQRKKSVTAGKWAIKKEDQAAPSQRHKDPAHRNAKPHMEVGAMRLLQSAKAAMDELISKSAEKNILEESALKYIKKMEIQRRKTKNQATPRLRLKPKGSISDLDSSISLRGSLASNDRRMTTKTGDQPASQLEWLRMRRDWLYKDLNERVVKVTLEELFKEEAQKADEEAKERERRGAEAQALISLGQQKHLIGSTQDGGEERTRSRRRAVLMEQQTENPEEEGFQAQVPKALLQALAAERDSKTQQLEICKSQQEAVAKKVMKTYGPNTWDYRLEAQYCIFFTNGWSMVLERLVSDFQHFQSAIPLLERLSLQMRMEQLLDDLRECRENVKELGRLQDEVRRKKNSQNSAEEAEQAAELCRKKVDKQHFDFLKKMKEWTTEVSHLDLSQVFEAKETRGQRMLKLESDVALTERKIADHSESFTKVVEENEEGAIEKALLEHLVETGSVLSRVTTQRKDASQELKQLQREAKEAGLVISPSPSLRRAESLRRGESFRGEDGTGSGSLDGGRSPKSPGSPRSPRSPKKKSTFFQAASLEHIEETQLPTAGGGKSPAKQQGSETATGPDTAAAAAAAASTVASAAAGRASVAAPRSGQRGTVRGSVVQRKGPRQSGVAKAGVNKVAGKLLENGAALLVGSGEDQAAEAFAKVLDNAGRRETVKKAPGSIRSSIRGSKVHGKAGDDLSLGAAQMQGKAMMRKLQHKQEELEKVIKEVEGRVGRIKKENSDTAAGWEERVKKLEQDSKTSQKMVTFWAQKLVEWHEDVQVRCGDEVLEELIKLSEADAANRDVTELHEALLRRAREEKAEIEQRDEIQRSVKDRLASAVETGDVSLFNLQQEVSNVISGLKTQNSLAVGNSSASETEELPRALKPRVAITPQQKSGRPPRNKLTAVEEKRQQLARLRMSQISASNFTVEKRKTKAKISEGEEEHPPGVDLQVQAPEANKVDPSVARTRRSLFSMKRQLGEGRRRAAITMETQMGLLCRPAQAADAGAIAAPMPEQERSLLAMQLGSRPKVIPTLGLNHKARQKRAAQARQLAAAAAASEASAARGSLRKLDESDSSSSSSSRQSSQTSDGGRKHSNASALGEDLGIWTFKTPQHRALLQLRSCRAKIIQRFGGVDKAYIRWVPALSGMTREVFRQLVNTMGFADEEAFEMYDLMKSSRPPKKRRASVSGSARGVSKQVEQEEPIDRTEFAEAMRKATPVKSVVQLRRRLRMKHSSCEAAAVAAFDARQALDREGFRNFMIQHGVSGREAYHLFTKMTKNNEGGGLVEGHRPGGHEEAPEEVTRFAFMKTLLHAEGLEAAEAFRSELVELLFDRGGRPGVISEQRGRRAAALLTQELLSALSEGVDRAWEDVDSPPVTKRSNSRHVVPAPRVAARQSVLATVGFGGEALGVASSQRRLSAPAVPPAPGPSGSQRRLSAAAVIAAPGPSGSRRFSAAAVPAAQGSLTAAQLQQDLEAMLSGQVQVPAVPEGGSSKHFTMDLATGKPSTQHPPRRASFSASSAAFLHAGAGAARRRSVDEAPSALRRRSLSQPASGALLLSGAHVALEAHEESGSDSSSCSATVVPQPQPSHRVSTQRRSSGLSSASNAPSRPPSGSASRRSSVSSSSGFSDTRSPRSSVSQHSEQSQRLSIFARKMHDETELQYDKVLIKVFDQLVCTKVDLWQPISRSDFVHLLKDLKLGEDGAKAIFKLSARNDGRASPGDVLLRVLGGFGRKYRKLRELMGLKVEFSSRQSSKRSSEEVPPQQLEVEKLETLPKELDLAVGRPVEKGKAEEQEEAKERARARLKKAVRQIGLTFRLAKNAPKASPEDVEVDEDAAISGLSIGNEASFVPVETRGDSSFTWESRQGPADQDWDHQAVWQSLASKDDAMTPPSPIFAASAEELELGIGTAERRARTEEERPLCWDGEDAEGGGGLVIDGGLGSSTWRWQKRELREESPRGEADMRDTVSTMPSIGDGDSSESSSRPTTMGSRGTARLPGSRGRQDTPGSRPMTSQTSPFEVGGMLAPLHEATGDVATSTPAVSKLRTAGSAVTFAKKVQNKAAARRTGATSSAGAGGEGGPMEARPGTSSRVPKLPALQEKQGEALEAVTATGFRPGAASSSEPLVLGLKGRRAAGNAPGQ